MKKPTTHKELQQYLDQIPEINEFMESFTIQMRNAILDRRIQLGWSQGELAKRVKQVTGRPITQTTISRIEGGSPGITSETYDKVLQTLGMTGIYINFGNSNSTSNDNNVSAQLAVNRNQNHL